MESKVKSFVSLAALVLLAACECGHKTDVVTTETQEIIDNDLGADSKDFIANAGDRVFFDFDKSSLSQESEATLLRQIDWLKSHSNRKVLIEGRCDERGTREYNIGLGERRADAIARFLIERGVAGDRVRTVSYGKDRPIEAVGSKAEIYRLNRVGISVIE
ncbi:MAG: peptidoglycan-associated lipoprotein [Alphaproteobacteria bacterium]|nr:peptidoglycan-associated lipoprotein [Alphaproteobacteria bacterium]